MSWGQLRISCAQTNLARLQTQISEQAIMPHFVIAARQLKGSPQSSVFDEDKITVQNVGAVVSDFRCGYVVAFDVELINQDNHEQRKARFFVNGYYFGQGFTASGKGLLVTIEGYQNNHKFSVLSRGFSDVAQSNKNYEEMMIRRFILLRYTNLLGKSHREYYYVPLLYGASRISQEDGEKIFQDDEKSFGTKHRFDFDEITPEGLHSLMMDILPKDH